MIRRNLVTCVRLVVAVLALALGMVSAMAQNNGNGQGPIKKNGPSSGNPQPSVCKPGQMLCTKSDDRWAAAINNANRRAEDIRKNGIPKKGGK